MAGYKRERRLGEPGDGRARLPRGIPRAIRCDIASRALIRSAPAGAQEGIFRTAGWDLSRPPPDDWKVSPDTIRDAAAQNRVTLPAHRTAWTASLSTVTQVIVLNGGSSSGKSGIARCLQAILPDPWLAMGIDSLIEAMPASMQSSDGGIEFAPDGEVVIGPEFRAVEAA
jgi:hypothetical protein